MGHLVRYRSPEGEQRTEEVDALDAAVERVEALHNEQGISDVRVYREVPLEVRTYVRVAVAGEPSPSAGPTDVPSGAAVIAPAPASPPSEQAPGTAGDGARPSAEAPAADHRRASLFSRGSAS